MAIPAAIIGGLISGAASGLMSSIMNKKKKVDTGAMERLVQRQATENKSLVAAGQDDLAKLARQYSQQSGELGAGYEGKVTDLAKGYQQNLANLGKEDQEAMQRAIALKTRQTSEQLPFAQQQIREALAASGQLRTGGAGKQLAQPTVEATREIGNLADTMSIQNLQAQSARAEKGVDTLYNTQAGAAFERFGLDKETMLNLIQNGRTDIINRTAQLLGINEQEITNLLGIQGIQTNASLANQAASNANQQSIIEAFLKYGIPALTGAGKGNSNAPEVAQS